MNPIRNFGFILFGMALGVLIGYYKSKANESPKVTFVFFVTVMSIGLGLVVSCQ